MRRIVRVQKILLPPATIGCPSWLEARRRWQLRWSTVDQGPARVTFLNRRATCIPVSQNETQTNLNRPT